MTDDELAGLYFHSSFLQHSSLPIDLQADDADEDEDDEEHLHVGVILFEDDDVNDFGGSHGYAQPDGKGGGGGNLAQGAGEEEDVADAEDGIANEGKQAVEMLGGGEKLAPGDGADFTEVNEFEGIKPADFKAGGNEKIEPMQMSGAFVAGGV